VFEAIQVVLSDPEEYCDTFQSFLMVEEFQLGHLYSFLQRFNFHTHQISINLKFES